MPSKPVNVMPWHKPEPHKPLKMQDKAAFKEHLMEHNAALDVDSPMAPTALCTLICTISDQCCDQDIIAKMIEYGMKVAKFDMALTDGKEQAILINKFRSCVMEYSKVLRRPVTVAIAVEIKGAAILIGSFLENIEKLYLRSGDIFILTANRAYDDRGTEEKVFVDYYDLPAVLQPKDKLLLDFGRIELRVRGVVDSDIVCEVIQGGELSPNSELTVVGVPLNIGPITQKDMEDLNFAVESEVDAIIVPMVRQGQSVENVRNLLETNGKHISVISKIDNRQAYDNINDIIRLSDGIIINRGCISKDLSTEKVMQAQKTMVAKANKAGKPVYAVTEYLNSMIHKNCPTFAEATDVINTIVEGVDGIILVDETSKGDHPTLVVRTLEKLCREAEAQIWQSDVFDTLTMMASPPIDPAHAICIATVEASSKVHAAAILIVTTSGKSAIVMARYRPRCPIFAMSRYGAVARRMNLYKGIIPVHIITPPHPCWAKDVDLRLQDGIDFGKEMDIIKPGDPLVLVNSWRPGAGFSNNIRVVYASPDPGWVLPSTTDEFLMD